MTISTTCTTPLQAPMSAAMMRGALARSVFPCPTWKMPPSGVQMVVVLNPFTIVNSPSHTRSVDSTNPGAAWYNRMKTTCSGVRSGRRDAMLSNASLVGAKTVNICVGSPRTSSRPLSTTKEQSVSSPSVVHAISAMVAQDVGAGVIGAGVTGAGVAGTGVGAAVIGAGVAGTGVGADVGADVTGAGVTGTGGSVGAGTGGSVGAGTGGSVGAGTGGSVGAGTGGSVGAGTGGSVIARAGKMTISIAWITPLHASTSGRIIRGASKDVFPTPTWNKPPSGVQTVVVDNSFNMTS
mmetsp:Transcript_45956/g.112129  ORF Transcript_45956/g.112129 Transcript_45956/m.112129 type:complete len:294 (-) Transcript_45956:597-1478(-)